MLDYLIDDGFIRSGDRIAVGVSGGADSMLLLCALLDKMQKVSFVLKVIHVNHHLRGKESDRDASFVKKFCEKHRLDYEIADVDVKGVKSADKSTLEEAARSARYDAIFKIMKRDKLGKLFLAHHQNDQAETILMNICRGSGLGGAAGMRNRDNIFRPLLGISKKKVYELCSENNIEFVTDSSNLESDCTRNYFRNVVIPEIEKVYPEAVKAIAQFGQRCAEVYDFVFAMVNEDLLIQEKGAVTLKLVAFDNPGFVAREYLKRVFEKLGIFADIEAKHYKLVQELAHLAVNSAIDLPHNIVARKTHAGVKFAKKTRSSKGEQVYEFAIGETKIAGFGTIVTEVISEFEVDYGNGCLFADFYKIPASAVWRFRKPGDEFAKLGSGSKKLNDYFTDKKIDIDERDHIPVLAAGSKILAVAGLDIGDLVKLVGPTDKVVKISFFKNHSS